MTLADLAINSFGYQALLFLHILAMIVGFGSTFVYPFLGAEAKQRRGIEAKALSEAGLGTAKIITTPVIYAGGALGLLLGIVGPWDFGDVWLSGAIVVFLASVIFAAFVHVPNLARMNAIIAELATTGPPPGAAELEKRGKDAARNGGILHLSLVVLLYLMIWKPGL